MLVRWLPQPRAYTLRTMAFIDDIASFFGFAGVLALIRSGRMDLHSREGFGALILAIFPTLLLVEIAFLCFVYRARRGALAGAFKIPAVVYIVNTSAALFVDLGVFVPTHHVAAVY